LISEKSAYRLTRYECWSDRPPVHTGWRCI